MINEKIWAVRGAITIDEDDAINVITATKELLEELFQRNRILPEQIVSMIFSVTSDINSEFPAVAAREIGLVDTPLFCTREMEKAGSLPLCIRVLIHFYTPLGKSEIKPVYLGEAVRLRPDLVKKEEKGF